ncbi:MAG: polysaccharide biosynthesis/export family protein [Bacteroides sp.]|uniref:polysaccharide biosynthesis/export family protein n=1 Tax=Bacteroides sp. TaxID=29523 RepID=UPI002FCC912F
MKKQFLCILCSILMVSCGTSQKILYLQDIEVNQPEEISETSDITVRPKDQISIIVSSKDPQLAALFNLPKVTYRVGNKSLMQGNSDQIAGYTIDNDGNIDFPVLGSLQIAGMSKKQIAILVKERLIKENLVNDPVVTVEFMNLYFSILGEVKSPGKFMIEKDQITLLEALSMAGDLTIYGKRDGIFVIREENGQRITHWIDLRSQQIFQSPVYYLKQNDIIYVQPNTVRAGQSTINENSVKSVSLWISIASFLSSLGVLLFK